MRKRDVLFVLIVLISCTLIFTGFLKRKKVIEQKPFTLEELSQFDGQEGRPTYVAIDGKVYDITKCKRWKDGVHDPSFGKAIAGKDLTEVMKDTPHGMKKLKRYPIVGFLVTENQVIEETSEEKIIEGLEVEENE